jgi:V8-like Glu-specific endopeptidase
MKRNSFSAKYLSMDLSLVGLAVAATMSVGFVNVTPKVIYGEDGRREIYEVESPVIRDLADSTVALIPLRNILARAGGTFEIKAGTMESEMRVCPSEPYAQQPAAAMCSGSLVGPDLIATAGHCVTPSDCSKYAFVFGYRMNNSSSANMSVAGSDVYSCKEIVAREYTNNQDYALVRLDRAVIGHRVLPIDKNPAQSGDEVFVVGHPSGLPTKVTLGGKVRSQQNGYFVTNLDTYGGNSGSAVFSAASNEMVGILVRGEADFVNGRENGKTCRVSNVCKEDGCRGEDVTNISYISAALNK